MADTNKVKFGIKNAHYALLTLNDDGSATYGTPVAVPGSVSLSIAPQGEISPFYADNIVYYQSGANAGYTGSWEIANTPDSFKKDVLGYIEDDNGILFEDANAEVKPFALMFQIEGDAHARRHVLYNCAASRPEFNTSTITDKKEPITDTIPLTATSVYDPLLQKDVVKAAASPTDSAYATWFESVYKSGGATPTP